MAAIYYPRQSQKGKAKNIKTAEKRRMSQDLKGFVVIQWKVFEVQNKSICSKIGNGKIRSHECGIDIWLGKEAKIATNSRETE